MLKQCTAAQPEAANRGYKSNPSKYRSAKMRYIILQCTASPNDSKMAIGLRDRATISRGLRHLVFAADQVCMCFFSYENGQQMVHLTVPQYIANRWWDQRCRDSCCAMAAVLLGARRYVMYVVVDFVPPMLTSIPTNARSLQSTRDTVCTLISLLKILHFIPDLDLVFRPCLVQAAEQYAGLANILT